MKPSGKLLRVEPNHGRKHKTETRIYAREIYETFCVQPGCKFNRQHAQQGVCYSTTPFVEGADWKYIDHAENHALEYLNEHRRLYRKEGPKKYIKACESLIMCYEMNSAFTLDELIRMRRKLALLKVQTTRKVGKRRKNRIKMMNRDVDAPRTRLAGVEAALADARANHVEERDELLHERELLVEVAAIAGEAADTVHAALAEEGITKARRSYRVGLETRLRAALEAWTSDLASQRGEDEEKVNDG